VEYVARQVGVARTEIAFYEWAGRTNRFHRNQIRGSLGFRECSVADADAVADWLVANVTQVERSADQVRARFLAHLRAERIEPPTGGRAHQYQPPIATGRTRKRTKTDRGMHCQSAAAGGLLSMSGVTTRPVLLRENPFPLITG
jgi:hypothetical protein